MISSILGFVGQAIEGAQSAWADEQKRKEEERKREEQKAREAKEKK